MTGVNVVALYVSALRRAVEQLIDGRDPDEISAAAADLKRLDPDHPALPALYARARERQARPTLH